MINFYKVGDKLLELQGNDLVISVLKSIGKAEPGKLVKITEKDLQRMDQIMSHATMQINKIRQSLNPENKTVTCFVASEPDESSQEPKQEIPKNE
ncbi:hypothetical protein GF312_17320 [Candidatus Poribacteria bacterium]|nr:hypothetical protein [Candidatus Poribacteria bacterium]